MIFVYVTFVGKKKRKKSWLSCYQRCFGKVYFSWSKKQRHERGKKEQQRSLLVIRSFFYYGYQ